MIHDVPLDLPDGEEILAVVSIRRQPGGQYAAQHHKVLGVDAPPAKHQAVLLRWLADALDINGLPEPVSGCEVCAKVVVTDGRPMTCGACGAPLRQA